MKNLGSYIIQGSFPGGMPHRSVIKFPTPNNNIIETKTFINQNYLSIQKISSGNAYQIDQHRLNLNSSGNRLPSDVRQKMESVFNADFSNVKIHTGGYQAESIGALAFTTGNDIYFAQGQYSPHSPYGQRILGHELTHVVQQRNGRVRNPFGNGIAVVNDHGMEAEAERMGIISTLIKPNIKVVKNIIQRVQDEEEAHLMVGAMWNFIEEDYKTQKYSPEEHNVCLAYVEFTDNTHEELWSFSNVSRLTKKSYGKVNKSEFIPDVKKLTYDPGGMLKYHTEVRLLNYIIYTYNMKKIKEITLTTARDCCISCKKVISHFRKDFKNIPLTVYELQAQIENWEPVSEFFN